MDQGTLSNTEYAWNFTLGDWDQDGVERSETVDRSRSTRRTAVILSTRHAAIRQSRGI